MNLIEKLGIEKCRGIVEGAPDGSEYFIIDFGYISNLGCVGTSCSSVVNATLHKDGLDHPITMNPCFQTVDSVVEFQDTVDLFELEQAIEKYDSEHAEMIDYSQAVRVVEK